MPRYDFSCAAGHTFEKKADFNTEIAYCECGAPARRKAVYRVGVSGFASTPGERVDFHQDYRRFSEATQENDYKASRFERDNGVEVKTPNLFKEAKVEAKKMRAAGVTTDSIKT